MTGKEYADKEYSNIDEGLKGIIAKSFDTGKGDIADLKANFDYVLEGKDLEIKTLGERCNQLLKDKGDLTDRVAELEQKLEQTEKDIVDYQFNYPTIKELEQESNKLLDVINNQDVKIADLEQKIEKMKKADIAHNDWYNSFLEKHNEEICKRDIQIAELEKEKCELLGIIQAKDELILSLCSSRNKS